MKPILIALTLSLTAAPALAMGPDAGSLFPTLTFPEPAPEPVTKDVSGIDK